MCTYFDAYKNRQYYRNTKNPDKAIKPKRLVFVRILLFRSAGSKLLISRQYPILTYHFFTVIYQRMRFSLIEFHHLLSYTTLICELLFIMSKKTNSFLFGRGLSLYPLILEQSYKFFARFLSLLQPYPFSRQYANKY